MLTMMIAGQSIRLLFRSLFFPAPYTSSIVKSATTILILIDLVNDPNKTKMISGIPLVVIVCSGLIFDQKPAGDNCAIHCLKETVSTVGGVKNFNGIILARRNSPI